MFRALFICKLRHTYGPYGGDDMSSGLYWSAKFVVDMLVANGLEAKLVQVIDNNDIDREVTAYQPTHTFIEALWVVPEKFTDLVRLHPTVRWIIRVHSNTPFIAQEGIATDWLSRYLDFGPTMFINCNGREMYESLGFYLGARYAIVRDNFGRHVDVSRRLSYLPNYYPVSGSVCEPNCEDSNKHISIGCFGSIRILKDQLIQAVSAIELAERLGKNLRFHINAGRIEGANQVLKNIRNLFRLQPRHELVEHDWMPRDQFLILLAQMEMAMQVSFSETFNICAADAADLCVPVVVSKEIPWANRMFIAETTDSENIVNRLAKVWRFRRAGIATLNKLSLTRYAKDAERKWLEFASR